MTRPSKVLLMFSGGQDSATCLAWAFTRFDYIETVAFSYGQRHAVELECRQNVLEKMSRLRPDWAMKLGKDHLIDIGALGEISETSLTRDVEIEVSNSGLPTTFVPGRNLIFLNFAAALGYRRGINVIVGGMCEADFSGYPDCRKDTLDMTMQSISMGMDKTFSLETPLMSVSKAGAWRMLSDIAGDKLVDLVRTETHTCYLGERGDPHDWGYGCGHCPACELREKGWREFQGDSA